jgi:hypothetical protein
VPLRECFQATTPAKADDVVDAPIHRHSHFAVALVAVSALDAQRLPAEVAVPIRIVVQPVLAIHSVVPTRVPTESREAISSATIVNVESNLPYRLTVRLAATAATNDARVFVRSADGTFQPLGRGASIAAVARGTPGQHAHEITCRVESSSSDGCALAYELSAEYHDVLIRSTASLCPDCGLWTAEAPPRERAIRRVEMSRGF